MQRQPVESSQIASIGYDGGARQLEIEFKGYGGKPGSVYLYENVEQDTYNGFFAKGPDDKPISIGRYFGTVIKADPKKYPFKRLGTAK